VPTLPGGSASAGAASASQVDDAASLSLAIQFAPNSSMVRPESGPLLGNLVAAMQSSELKGNRFLIEGHTDGAGTSAANLKLSQERAEEVRQYLVALGVPAARLRAVGKGASHPANPRDPLAPENRRVRVVTIE
jgi:outer membrane protein OmpA-like peptidoglycan-associated protein